MTSCLQNLIFYCVFSKEIEKKIKELQAGAEELKKEVVSRQNESKTLKEDLEKTNHQIATDKKEYETLSEELEKLKVKELLKCNLFSLIAKLYLFFLLIFVD